jgi:hypothetical protein
LLVHFQGYFTLFPFQKIKHSNRITVGGSNLAASLCSKYNSNSVPHLVFPCTYQIYLSPASTGKNSWVLHMILPQEHIAFVVLSFRLKLPGTPD